MFFVAIVVGVAQGVFAPVNVAVAAPTPIPHPSQTVPPDLAAPSPTPLPLLVSGQLIDLERGFGVLASEEAFARLSPTVSMVADDLTVATPGIFSVFFRVCACVALMQIGPVDVKKNHADADPRGITPGRNTAPICCQGFIATAEPRVMQNRSAHVSKLSSTIQVDIVVEVPASTSYTDDVYMATDTSGWNPRAIRMQRIDGRHFRISLELPFNTDFHYMFTRGSWTTVERDRAGLQRQPRELAAGGAEELLINATVFRWADDS